MKKEKWDVDIMDDTIYIVNTTRSKREAKELFTSLLNNDKLTWLSGQAEGSIAFKTWYFLTKKRIKWGRPEYSIICNFLAAEEDILEKALKIIRECTISKQLQKEIDWWLIDDHKDNAQRAHRKANHN